MPYNGKRTGRTDMPRQLCNDPDLGADIRMLARVNRRTIQLQILNWIVEGVEKDKAKLRQFSSDELRSATEPKSEKVRSHQIPAERRTA